MSLRDLNVAILRLLELNIVQVYKAGDYICIHLLLCNRQKGHFLQKHLALCIYVILLYYCALGCCKEINEFTIPHR